jgi:hypothetical protein
MERDEFERDAFEMERCQRDAAIERSIAHVKRELLAPETLQPPWRGLLDALPDPRDERPWTRADENAYFARENAAAVRELAESALLREQMPALCKRSPELRVDPFARYFDLSRAEEGLAKMQNRPVCSPLICFDGPKHCWGFFNPRDNQIGLNVHLFSVHNPRYLLRAYLHEARHAFQFHAIRSPEAHPDLHPSTIVEWNRASQMYARFGSDPTPAELEAYETNGLEIDARTSVDRKERQIDGT